MRWKYNIYFLRERCVFFLDKFVVKEFNFVIYVDFFGLIIFFLGSENFWRLEFELLLGISVLFCFDESFILNLCFVILIFVKFYVFYKE